MTREQGTLNRGFSATLLFVRYFGFLRSPTYSSSRSYEVQI
ncbi:hypothetical protein PN451_05740 [Dolichospermum planctonicum CS-1226]|uniref:Transposase n=1 Tax=Dolichospermum planctonicum CS-1226 TaxID=3021751 RepID=A0ABT5ADI9_9CYAN|nr:hypothetical protein [Dolichospermum planctonicum CS-1226]